MGGKKKTRSRIDSQGAESCLKRHCIMLENDCQTIADNSQIKLFKLTINISCLNRWVKFWLRKYKFFNKLNPFERFLFRIRTQKKFDFYSHK